MKRPDWFNIGALVFGLWGLANTAVSIGRYGWEQGMYLWFCNLALLATAFGLWRRNRDLLLAFLGVATFTQPLYVIDSLLRLFSSTSLLGASEFMYQPGMGIGEFLLSRYHYFVIPTMAFALFRLPKGRSRLLTYIASFEVGIFSLSYIFPFSQNINCIHESCFESLQYAGPLYSLGFFLLILSGNVAGSLAWDWVLGKAAARPEWGKKIAVGFGVLLGLGVLLTGADTLYKKRLPKLTCAPPFEDSGVRVQCLYTLEDEPGLVELTYTIENKLDVAQHCDARGDLFGEYEEMKEALYLKPHEKIRLKALLPYPPQDAELKVAASCIRLQ